MNTASVNEAGNSIIEAGNNIVIKDHVTTTKVNKIEIVPELELVKLEQCDICSSQYELPGRTYAQPDLNRLICKVLQIEPQKLSDGQSYFSQYIAVCSSCALRIRRYDKQRIELDILRQEIVSSVLDTIVHIRPNDVSPVHSIKEDILERWSSGSPIYTNSSPSKKQESPVEVTTEHPIDVTQLAGLAKFKACQYVRKQNFGQITSKSVESAEVIPMKKSKDVVKSSNPIATSVVSINRDIPITTTQSECNDLNGGTWLTSTTHFPSGEQHEEGPWTVSTEVSIFPEGEPDPTPQLITNYVTENILVDHEYAQEHEDNRENCGNDNDGDCVIPSGDEDDNDIEPCDEDDSDYSPSETFRTPKRKQTLVKDDLNLETIDLQTLSNRGIEENVPKKKKKRASTFSHTAPQHKKVPYICEGCGRVFSKLQTLRRHVQKLSCRGEDEMIPKVCSICLEDFSVSGWRALKLHIDEKHEIIELDKCRFCRKEFLPNTFELHQCCRPAEVPRLKDYKCDYCEKVYHSSNSLSEHIRKYHDKGNGRIYKCDVCDKSFLSESIKNSHMATHRTKVTPFACDKCGICTSTSWGLREHFKVHTGEKPHRCEICGKTFRIRNILRNHMVVHTKEKNFVCDICKKPFSLYCTMLRHWKNHNNPIPGKGESCPICEGGPLFKKTRTLKEHMVLRHPGTQEQFDICARPVVPGEKELKSRLKSVPNPSISTRVLRKIKPKVKKWSESDSDSESDVQVVLNNLVCKSEVNAEDDNSNPNVNIHTDSGSNETSKKMGLLVKEETPRTTKMSTRFGGKRIVCTVKQQDSL